MLRPNQSQTNFFSVLYDRIPEDHLLKRIANAVDFSFINELVADSYCASFGRPAKEAGAHGQTVHPGKVIRPVGCQSN